MDCILGLSWTGELEKLVLFFSLYSFFLFFFFFFFLLSVIYLSLSRGSFPFFFPLPYIDHDLHYYLSAFAFDYVLSSCRLQSSQQSGLIFARPVSRLVFQFFSFSPLIFFFFFFFSSFLFISYFVQSWEVSKILESGHVLLGSIS